MFDILSRGFKSAQLMLQGKTELTEENLGPALREVRASLIQADVEIGVAKAFLDRVKQTSLGTIVPLKLPTGQTVPVSPQDWFIKNCYDQLVTLMGPVDTSLNLAGKPAVILMVGLQGSGKTTTTAKLAKKLVQKGKKPLLVAADIYRPAAVDQLMILGRKLGVPVFNIKGMDPVKLSQLAVTQAKNVGRDVVIIDTAGRLAIDETLMTELEQIKNVANPSDILFVCDAMIGQDAVKTAAEFDRRLAFTGFILTKLDGDARGGAALSIKEVTGKPIKYLGQGEDLDKLEEFRPEGLAQRILGFGDVVGLMQDFERHVDKDTAEADAKKMLAGQFTYDDFVRQLRTIRKMGPIKDLFSRMPGISSMMEQIPDEALDDRELDRTLAIIFSMTQQERKHPEVLDAARFRRIARGSGRDVKDVEALHERFITARGLMKDLGGLMGDPNAMAKLQQRMAAMQGQPGVPGGALGGTARVLTAEEKDLRRKRAKAAAKARKKNR